MLVNCIRWPEALWKPEVAKVLKASRRTDCEIYHVQKYWEVAPIFGEIRRAA
jgi:hypothetical protein